METNLQTLEEKYCLKEDLVRLEKKIKKQKPHSILLQFPDGLKPYATEITREVRKLARKNVSIKIWLGSCFGACDIPNSEADLLVQFGHAPWS